MKLYAKANLLNVAEPGQEFEIDDKAGKVLVDANEAETVAQRKDRLEAEKKAAAKAE